MANITLSLKMKDEGKDLTMVCGLTNISGTSTNLKKSDRTKIDATFGKIGLFSIFYKIK